MTLQSRLADLVTAIGADIKDLKSRSALIASSPPDSWHTVGTAGEPAFGVKWQAFAPYTPQFKKMPDGTVRIRGMVSPAPSGGGAFTTVFTLPAGYRPSADLLRTALMSNGAAELISDIRVTTNGDIQFGVASSSYHTLDISFPTEVAAVVPVIQSSVSQEGWHLVGTTGEPAFGAGFSNYAGETPAGFRKDPSGQVFLRGLLNAPAVAASQTATVFTLPVGYRPTSTIRVIAPGGGGTAFYRILPDGTIQLFNSTGYSSVGTANWIDLSEITFFVDQSTFPASTASSLITVTQEAWHTVGAAGEPAFQNSWVHYDSPGGRVAKFRKDPAGVVTLEGIIKGGADGTVAFTLPAGYRPDQTHFFAVRGTAGATLVSVQVGTDGTVAIYGAGAAPNGYSYLNGVTFDTGQLTFPAAKSFIATVTALPSNPNDGDEVYYQSAAMKVDGLKWHLQYDASAPGAYKWIVLSGEALRLEGVGGRDFNTAEQTTSLTSAALTTAGPSIAVPLAGEYDVTGAAQAKQTGNGGLASLFIWLPADGAVAWNNGDGVHYSNTEVSTSSRINARRLRTLAAGGTVELRYATSSAPVPAAFYNRSIYAKPIRVG